MIGHKVQLHYITNYEDVGDYNDGDDDDDDAEDDDDEEDGDDDGYPAYSHQSYSHQVGICHNDEDILQIIQRHLPNNLQVLVSV